MMSSICSTPLPVQPGQYIKKTLSWLATIDSFVMSIRSGVKELNIISRIEQKYHKIFYSRETNITSGIRISYR